MQATRFWEAATFSEFACDLIVDCCGHVLCPGMIDIQTNGAYGCDFSDPAITTTDIHNVCTKLLATGCTSICPTLVSSASETYTVCLDTFRELMAKLEQANEACVRDGTAAAVRHHHHQAGVASFATSGTAATDLKPPVYAGLSPGCRIIGLHLEGPFIHPDRKGAHKLENLRQPNPAAGLVGGGAETPGEASVDLTDSAAADGGLKHKTDSSNNLFADSQTPNGDDKASRRSNAPVTGLAALSRVYGPVQWSAGEARIVTLAPELDGALDAVQELARAGVVAAIGHTTADIRCADAAIERGSSLITHLFNAMSAFHHRDPGVVGLLGRMPGGAAITSKARRRHSRILVQATGMGAAGLATAASTGALAGEAEGSDAAAPHPSLHLLAASRQQSAVSMDESPLHTRSLAHKTSSNAFFDKSSGSEHDNPDAAIGGMHRSGASAPTSPVPDHGQANAQWRGASSGGNGIINRGQRAISAAEPLPPPQQNGLHIGARSPISAAAAVLALVEHVTPYTPVPFRPPMTVGGGQQQHGQAQNADVAMPASFLPPAVSGQYAQAAASPPMLARRSYGSGLDSDVLHTMQSAGMITSSAGSSQRHQLQHAVMVDGTINDGYDDSNHSKKHFDADDTTSHVGSPAPINSLVLPRVPVEAAPASVSITRPVHVRQAAQDGGSDTPVNAEHAKAAYSFRGNGFNATSVSSDGPSGYLSAGRGSNAPGTYRDRDGGVAASAKGATAQSFGLHGVGAHGHHGAVTTAVHERPYYGIIADGVHVHPYAVNIAYETHPDGLILVTDAMKAMGLPVGRHTLGELEVDIYHGREDGHYEGLHAVLAGTATLAGAVVPLDECVRNLLAFTGCPLAHALAAVTTHPASVLRLGGVLGSLETGCWADMILIDSTESFTVMQTWVAGQLVWKKA